MEPKKCMAATRGGRGGSRYYGIRPNLPRYFGKMAKKMRYYGIRSPLSMRDLAFKHTVLREKTIWKTVIRYKYVIR